MPQTVDPSRPPAKTHSYCRAEIRLARDGDANAGSARLVWTGPALLLCSILLFAHLGCHGDEDNELAVFRAGQVKPAAPSWVGPMKEVHGRFKGTPGTFALFGDSITVSMAFWAPLAGNPKNMPPEMAKAHALVKSYLKPECWNKWRGPDFGNQGSMTIRWPHAHIDAWLKKLNPEVALIMFGTNDLGQVPLQEYDEKTRAVVDKCLHNGTVVILSTIPPRSGRLEQAAKFADTVRQIAKDKQVPLCDYFAAVVQRRPDDWDGALPKFKDAPGDAYQVPTLIARDGVHPSNPKSHQDYSEESLCTNGFVLRNYLAVLAYAEVARHVLKETDRK